MNPSLTMVSSKIKYTSNKAIDHFNAGATLMKITGYVDCIEGLRELPKSNSKWIYKCILNNNDGRRVRVIFSGDDALKYNGQIKMYQILKITGGVIKAASAMYRSSTDTISDKEFQLGRGSTIDVLGTIDVANGANESRQAAVTYEPIEMENVCVTRGPVIITGWIKEVFRSISTSNGSSYGSGMLCTDVHRMSVHVTTFIPKDELTEGLKVKIKGTVERRGDAFVLNVSSMDQIEMVPGALMMTEDEMDDAVESPPLTLKRQPPVLSPEALEMKKPKYD